MPRYRNTIAALAFTFSALPLFAASTVRHDMSAAVDAGALNRVVVEIPYVHLTIMNGESKKIDAFGYVTRSWRTSKQRDAAQLMVDDTGIRIDIEGTTAFIRGNHGPNAQSGTAQGSKSMYVVAVRAPKGTDIRTRTRSGSLTIKGSFGTIDTQSSSGDVVIEVPKKNVGELIARTRFGHLSVHLGDRVIENEGFLPRKAHYFYEGGQNVLTATLTRGDISIKLLD